MDTLEWASWLDWLAWAILIGLARLDGLAGVDGLDVVAPIPHIHSDLIKPNPARPILPAALCSKYHRALH